MMGNLSLFLKSNQKMPKPVKKAVTKTLCDEKGKPLEWTIRPITSSENDALREACTVEVPVPGKPGIFRTKTDTSCYIAKLIAAAVVEPDLKNAELQDSYGVKKPEDLIRELVPIAGEYSALGEFIQDISGFDVSFGDKVEQAKN